MVSPTSSLREYFEGERLYGDDFSLEQIKAWHEDEKEGYATLIENEGKSYSYKFHGVNLYYGFKYLPDINFSQVLGFGSAYGDEIEPIAHRIWQLTIVEPSKKFKNDFVHGIKTTYIQPSIEGKLPFTDNLFDLITCLGVLHHIPNVSFVMHELYRCLRPGGFIVIREPIISMGDWTKPRRGATKRERGIPIKMFRQIIDKTEFTIISEKICMCNLTYIMGRLLNIHIFNSSILMRLDEILSRIFIRNLRYHQIKFIHKFRPTSVFYVLSKKLY